MQPSGTLWRRHGGAGGGGTAHIRGVYLRRKGAMATMIGSRFREGLDGQMPWGPRGRMQC